MTNKYEELSHVRKQLQADSLAPSWMSTASYQLLHNQSYLTTAETPRDMYTRVAQRAADLTTFPIPESFGYNTWFDAFFDVFWKGWLSGATPVLTNMGTNRGHAVSCLTGDSWINTKHEGGTLMRDLKVGDKVLTHKGVFRKVTHKQSRMSENDLYQLKVSTRTTPIKITGNHPVKTNMGWVRVDELDPKHHLIATNDVISYTEVNHTLEMRDYITYPTVLKDGYIYRKQNTKSTKPSRQLPDGISKQSSPIKEYVRVTRDLSWALGLWFAEGSHCTDVNKKLNGIKITMNVNEIKYLEKFADIMLESFGVTSTISKQDRAGSLPTLAVCTISNSVLAEMFFTEFGRGAKSKNVAIWMKTLPKDSLRAIVDGVYRGDGKKVTKNSTYITLTNPKLVMSLYEIGLKAGMQIGLQMQEKAGKRASVAYVQRLSLYNYKLGTSSHSIHSIPFEDGLRYCPFKLLKLEVNETVYDITVEKDHSFSTAGVVVHNCSGTFIGDSIREFYEAYMEIAQLTQRGYGTSWSLDPIRARGEPISKGGTANGIMQPAARAVQDMKDISQGARYGNIGQYLSVLHKDFDELIDQLNSDNDSWNVGWNIEGQFRALLERHPEEADLIWKKVMRTKASTGKGYLWFSDKVNAARPQMYKDRGFFVKHSNLCIEIALMSDKDHSFTCVLSSMNISKYDEWKDTKAVQIATVFLDAVVSDTLIKCKQEAGFERIIAFAEKSRALGLGQLGQSTYFQQKGWAFGDIQSKIANRSITQHLVDEALAASSLLADNMGEPEWMVGYGRRNSHLLAFPPTKSTAVIMGGVSEGIAPVFANVYDQDTAGGTVYRINPVLLTLMKERNQYNDTTMKRITSSQGSVHGEDWLTADEKDVFKTAFEVSSDDIIDMASDRQKILNKSDAGQGQSLNFYFQKEESEEEISRVHAKAMYDEYVQATYYAHFLDEESVHKADKTCQACEG